MTSRWREKENNKQLSNWGNFPSRYRMPPRHPFFIGKYQVTFQHTIFLLLHALCIFLGASVIFSFQFYLVLFSAINGCTPTNFFWRSCLAFHLPRTLRFSLLPFQQVFSFSATAFSFSFSPWFLFRSCYIFASRCILNSGTCWFSSKELFIKSSNDVGKEKKLYAKKKWYKKELV
jgi:hypothetical protein